MTNEEEAKFYSPSGLEVLKTRKRELSRTCELVRDRLNNFKKSDHEAWKSKRITLEFMTDGKIGQPERKELSENISDLLHNAESVCEQLEELSNDHDSFMTQRIKDDQRHRKAERKDRWKLWFDQLIRWGVGISLAITLYSCFVYVSDSHCVADDGASRRFCIRIPIKDWIPH